jgi:hypothetical protein
MKGIYILILCIIIFYILTNTFLNFNNLNNELYTDSDFDIYVINLKKNKERLDFFMKEYK